MSSSRRPNSSSPSSRGDSMAGMEMLPLAAPRSPPLLRSRRFLGFPAVCGECGSELPSGAFLQECTDGLRLQFMCRRACDAESTSPGSRRM